MGESLDEVPLRRKGASKKDASSPNGSALTAEPHLRASRHEAPPIAWLYPGAPATAEAAVLETQEGSGILGADSITGRLQNIVRLTMTGATACASAFFARNEMPICAQ